MNYHNNDDLLMDEVERAQLASRALGSSAPLEGSAGRAMLEKTQNFYRRIKAELGKVIVGQSSVLELILAAMLARGHVLLEGVPGLGKTLMFKTLSKLMTLNFQHIQFTPDLMPSDILGTEILETDQESGVRSLRFLKGPIFSNFLLADEINRTSPKTQAALLQAMQDREISIGRKIYPLEPPFFVLATQNPMDQEGVYPLPEAQLDRFMLNIFIDYPAYEEELEIARRFTSESNPMLQTVVTEQDFMALQQMVRSVLIAEPMLIYAVNLVASTRPRPNHPLSFVSEQVSVGAGPRATLNIILAAKARALLNGRFCVSVEDIHAVAPAVLRHRIKLNFTAQAEEIKTMDVIERLLTHLPKPNGR